MPRHEDTELARSFLAGESETITVFRSWMVCATWRLRRHPVLSWEDVEQELLLALTLALRSGAFRGDASLKTYVWRMARHRYLNILRDHRRSREMRLDDGHEPASRECSPLAHVLQDEAVDRLRHVLAAMSPRCRVLCGMLAVGMSREQIGARLGISAGAVRVRISRCRRQANDLRAPLAALDK